MVIGWVLYIGKDVFVPIIFGALVVYVIAGLTRLLGRLPVIGRILPPRIRSALSVLVIACGLVAIANLVLANRQRPGAGAAISAIPLAAIQRGAVFLRIETEPTWATLRRDLLTQISFSS